MISEEGSSSAVEIVQKKDQTIVVSGISSEELSVALKEQSKQRKLIAEFIKKHLKKDVDYGKIEGTSKTGKKFNSGNVLFKPGQEKIFSLFQLTSKLTKDEETLSMLVEKNVVAYKCEVYRGGEFITEGRGAAKLGDMGRDVNATIKIAEKRARMDACLSLGFSEYFTQDMDDPDYKRQTAQSRYNERVTQVQPKPVAQNTLPNRPANAPMDDMERAMLFKLMIKAGIDSKEEQIEVLRVNGINDPQNMTSSNARSMINKLKSSAFTKPPKKTEVVQAITDEELENVEAIMDALPDDMQIHQTPIEEPKEPEQAKIVEDEFIVDNEYKSAIQLAINHLGLNASGKMWVMRLICNKPYAKFEDLTEGHWRMARNIVDSLVNGEIHIDESYKVAKTNA